MKKYFIFIILILVPLFLFSEKIRKSYNCYVYVNNDGSLDWETFYSDWDSSAMKYMYVYITARHIFNTSNEMESYLSYSKNDNSGELYSFYYAPAKMEYTIIFSIRTYFEPIDYFDPEKYNLEKFLLLSEYYNAIQFWNNNICEHGTIKQECILILNESTI